MEAVSVAVLVAVLLLFFTVVAADGVVSLYFSFTAAWCNGFS